MTFDPEQSQHMQALDKANRIRKYRASIKRQIKSKRLTVGDALDLRNKEFGTLTLYDLLRSQVGWGPRRARTFLSLCAIPESKEVLDLTDRQVVLVKRELDRALR